jgi:hypothetical protein
MGVLLHVSLPETITNESQIKIANYLAESLSESWDVIFWMDKISNAQIFQEFTRRTDKLVTAGSGEADIVVTNSESKESKPILYRNVSDNTPRASNAHYLLSFDQNSIQFLNNFYQITPSSQSALKKSEFTPLFDGETFNGWTVTGDQSGWRINDHSFEWVKQGGGYLRTTRRYEDFILELEWKIEKGGNSGVFINAPLGGRASRIGMEIQIMGDYGESPHKNSSGAIYDVAAPLANPSRPEEEWNQMQIYSHGSNLQVRINNTLVQDHDLDQNPELKVRLRRGFIMLQDHGSPVSFRNIRIKEL